MNREIKFRAWDGVDMIYFGLHDRDYHATDGSLPIMQFTGLKDKTGKDVYEGDVIGHDEHPLMVVEWNEKWHSFGTQHIGQTDSFAGLPEKAHASRAWVVIGNIYENPELLAPPLSA